MYVLKRVMKTSTKHTGRKRKKHNRTVVSVGRELVVAPGRGHVPSSTVTSEAPVKKEAWHITCRMI